MKWNGIPAFTFTIALSFFALVYAINASGAWHSAGQWIREYQTVMLSIALLASVGAIFFWRGSQERQARDAPSIPEIADHLRRVNDVESAFTGLRILILAGLANEPAVVGNPNAYFQAMQRCDETLRHLRVLVGRVPQDVTKLSEFQFIQTCESFLDIARQIAPGGHVDFARSSRDRRLEFNLRINQCYASLIEKWRITTDRLGEQIRGMETLLFDIKSRISANAP